MERTAAIYDVMIKFGDVTGFPTFPLQDVSVQQVADYLNIVRSFATTNATDDTIVYGSLLHGVLPFERLTVEEMAEILLGVHGGVKIHILGMC